MRFLSIDQHISVIADIKAILRAMGHTVDDLCLSSHAHIMQRAQDRDRIPELSGDLWRDISDNDRWADVAAAHADEWNKYDAFITTHPPLFARALVRFGKPVVSMISIRVDSGVHDSGRLLTALIDDLKKPNVILCANNKVDAIYSEALTGKSVTHIPSLCAYTQAKYAPVNNRVLSYESVPMPELDRSLIAEKSVLGENYKWQDVAGYKAVVHFPYQVSTMSIFEQYTAGIPIIVPSLDFMMDLWHDGRVLEHLSNASLWKTAHRCAVPFDRSITDGHDINDCENGDAVRWWAALADYYDDDWMPDTVKISSFDELHTIAKQSPLKFKFISNSMTITNIERRQRVYSLWEETINRVKDMLC